MNPDRVLFQWGMGGQFNIGTAAGGTDPDGSTNVLSRSTKR